MIPVAIIVACLIVMPVEARRDPERFWMLAAVTCMAVVVMLME
jgi:hypothetical protein